MPEYWTVTRPVNGISLNGVEYLCDENGLRILYDSEESARADLRSYGYSDKDIEDEGIIIVRADSGGSDIRQLQGYQQGKCNL
jgi:hypothetical protein